MKIDPVSLRLFVAVVEEGKIAAAAQREHLATAAVSKRLSELEQQLDTQLFNRSNKGIVPTPAGMALLNLARGVLNDFDNIAAQMHDFASGTRGSVRVLANISVITQFMPLALKTFMEEHPLIQIHLEEKISSAILRGVAENMADIGIFAQAPHPESLEVTPFRTDELVVILPAAHALAGRSSLRFAELLDEQFVGLHAGSSLNYQMIKEASELGRTVKMRIQVTGYDAQCLMVEAGLGIGILPRASAGIYRALAIKTVPLDEPWARRQLNICVRAYSSLPPAAKLLFDHLLAKR
ncbi:LysR family transcriptional regulator [Noviherbaspirillum galbum]|uniref:LysR family transcriptional regulator n=1 Tax=Noviherbaspirillum galbum TaxID=2709383 RepID=A0A6B3SZG6_9BURK|nr:LysR family transcriptional regulator [Noviherbaspirillum galbum]NEX64672.1 LysR family transcriptional regulator [Noviherbaspirillum galbum]